MKRRSVLLLSAIAGLGALVPVWAQRTVERTVTPEGMARNLSLDLRDARTLWERILLDSGPRAGRDREGSREQDAERRRTLDADRRRLSELLERTEKSAHDLDEVLRASRERSPLRPGGSLERPTLTDFQFNEIVLAVRKARSAGEERRIVQDFAKREYLTTRQLRALIPVLDQPNNQEEAAVLLYPKLIDPDRFYTIRDVFKVETTWDNVTKRLGMR